MRSVRWLRVTSPLLFGILLWGGGAVPEQEVEHRGVFAVIQQPTRGVTLYATGERVMVKCHTVCRPMCGTPEGAMTRANLLAIAARHAAELAAVDDDDDDQANADGAEQLTSGGAGATDGGHITIIFKAAPSVPAGAITALDAVKAYIESQFSDPIIIKINVSFQALGPGILGQTSSNYAQASWPQSRAGLVNGMDDNDEIQAWLPTTSTIPVRYNGDTNTITNENRVFWTLANYRATIGAVSGLAADMVFNSNFSWDYDPSDGVTGYSFEDVVIHECGHVLGFDSGIDFRINDIEALDVFRFQRTNGDFDYNPDTLSEFQTRPRLASFNKPNGDHICDLISAEYRMCDGMPNQASHFKNKTPPIGLMDPALGPNTTFFPNFYSSADLAMFDAIGYDR